MPYFINIWIYALWRNFKYVLSGHSGLLQNDNFDLQNPP